MTTPGGWDDLAQWVAYLKEIGVRDLDASAWVRPGTPATPTGSLRAAPEPPRRAKPKPKTQTAAPGAHAKALGLIREDLGDCTRCKLHGGRNQIVFGVGNPDARLMFVGEGPGAEEDARGEPFVGRAGKKLDQMIESVGLTRAEVYIANIVKCRPPNNRDPEKDEIETCLPFLKRQIEAIGPRAIVALGSPAAKTLLETRTGITRLRGEWHDFAGIPVMPTFHPAYLLRAYTKENRLKVWEDLKAAKARIDE
jgi:uracil-DNA glycosylase family 4